VAGGDPVQTVRANITLSRPSPIGEGDESAQITSSDAVAWFENPDVDSAFSASVLPYTAERGAYAAFVEPSGDAEAVFPPVRLLDQRIEQPTGRFAYRLEVTLPPTADLRKVVGRVMRDISGVANLSVWAESPVTGIRISTITKTATAPTMAGGDPVPPPEGTFEIFLPADTATFRLVVAPTVDNPTVPTTVWHEIDFDALDLNHDNKLCFDTANCFDAAGATTPPDQPPLALPAFNLVSLEGTVEGTEAGIPGAVPVPGATLTFSRDVPTGDEPDVTATFEQFADTDIEGQIVPRGCDPACTPGVGLLEGDYEVTIKPPASRKMAGLYREFLRIARPSPEEPVQRGQVFQLDPRADLAGSVLDLMGRPAGAVSIESRLLTPALDGPAPGADPIDLNASITASTDFDGVFDMFVEPGTHVLVLRPAESMLFPWRLVPGVAAPDGAVNTSLEAPVVVSGILTIGGESTAGVVIEALVRDESYGDTTIKVGRAETDGDGAFQLLLSPSL
jgi:hypothetical protein